MTSLNFEFLRPKFGEMADLAAFAELYIWPDAASASVKLRAFAELLTGAIYQRFRFPRPFEDEFAKLLNAPEFKAAVPPAVQNALHALRKDGNQASHGGSISSERARELLITAFRLAHWWSAVDSGTKPTSLPAFVEPLDRPPAPNVAAQGAAVDEKVRELELLQRKYEQVAQQAAQLATARDEAQQTADLLDLTEEETRRQLIDRDLAQAGWKVGHHGSSTVEVTQEHPLPTGERADYVLWDDNGKPLAVVEAKKTSRDVDAGRKQASLYADALEKQYGQRPVVFTTNGHDVEIWETGYPPRAVFGFYSKDSLQYAVYQRAAKKPLANVTIDPAITNRLYQIEAIRRVSERFTANFRKSLVVQATGTGKTRVAISLADVLMRAGWVKRVLFLCDRTELRKQARNAFREFLDEPVLVLDSASQDDRSRRIYLATYPALDGFYRAFDPGFFQLLIADESHRSIYNHYLDLLPVFLHASLLYDFEVRRQLGVTQHGAVMAGLNMPKVKDVSIAVPPICLQKNYEAYLRKFFLLRTGALPGFLQATAHLNRSFTERAFHRDV